MIKNYLDDFLNQGVQWKRFFHSALNMYSFGRGYILKREDDKITATGELIEIFWEQPRPLLIEAIPSLLRKIEGKWKQLGLSNQVEEDKGSRRPMPQSIPKATFEELDLNESRIELEDYQRRDKQDELIPMPQFLRECCPGRVSKRFSTLAYLNPPEPGYWHEYSIQLQQGQNNLSFSQLYPQSLSLGKVDKVQINSATNAKLTHIPFEILESSSSEWIWKTIANVRNDASSFSATAALASRTSILVARAAFSRSTASSRMRRPSSILFLRISRARPVETTSQ